MKEYDGSNSEEEQVTKEEKPFTCTGCGYPLGKYDEKCPNCERVNPNYILR